MTATNLKATLGRARSVTAESRPKTALGLVFVRYRRLGLWQTLAKVVRLAISTVYSKRVELLFVKKLDTEKVTLGDETGLQIRSITKYHSSLIEKFNQTYRDKNAVVSSNRCLKNDYKGFLAFLNDKPIGFLWWVNSEIDPKLTHPCVTRFELRLKDDEVFAFDYFIAPQYRQHATAFKFLSMIYSELRKLGYIKIWGFVDANNAAAQVVYKLKGNKVVRRIVSYKLLSTFLIQDRRVFIRNTRRNPNHSFEYRLLFSLRTRNVRT